MAHTEGDERQQAGVLGGASKDHPVGLLWHRFPEWEVGLYAAAQLSAVRPFIGTTEKYVLRESVALDTSSRSLRHLPGGRRRCVQIFLPRGRVEPDPVPLGARGARHSAFVVGWQMAELLAGRRTS